MSQENVEVFRRVLDAWNRGALGEWKPMYHPDVVAVPPEGWPEGEQTEGFDAWLRQARRLTDSWDEQRIDVEELREADDRVLAVFRWIVRGKDSHIGLDTRMAAVVTVRRGKIARLEFFPDREQALEALGLPD
jgi:ketosteroid isomerase-like protein